MHGAFFLSGLPPYSAACGGGSAQSERTLRVQATTRSARAKWVRAWVRISSQIETRSEVSAKSGRAEFKGGVDSRAVVLPERLVLWPSNKNILIFGIFLFQERILHVKN